MKPDDDRIFDDDVKPRIRSDDTVEWAQNPRVRIEATLIDGYLRIRGLDGYLAVYPVSGNVISVELIKVHPSKRFRAESAQEEVL